MVVADFNAHKAVPLIEQSRYVMLKSFCKRDVHFNIICEIAEISESSMTKVLMGEREPSLRELASWTYATGYELEFNVNARKQTPIEQITAV